MAAETALTAPSNLFNKYSGVLCADLYAPPVLSLTSLASLLHSFVNDRSRIDPPTFLTTGFPSSQSFRNRRRSFYCNINSNNNDGDEREFFLETNCRVVRFPGFTCNVLGLTTVSTDIAKVPSKSLWNGESTTISHFNPFSISPPIIQPLPKPYLWCNFTSSD
jgi:hypothetical protein